MQLRYSLDLSIEVTTLTGNGGDSESSGTKFFQDCRLHSRGKHVSLREANKQGSEVSSTEHLSVVGIFGFHKTAHALN